MGADRLTRKYVLPEGSVWKCTGFSRQASSAGGEAGSSKAPARAVVIDVAHVNAGGVLRDEFTVKFIVHLIREAVDAGAAAVVILMDGRDSSKYPVPGSVRRSHELIIALAKLCSKTASIDGNGERW